MDGWTIFWVVMAAPAGLVAGLACGIWIAREIFDVDLLEIFHRRS